MIGCEAIVVLGMRVLAITKLSFLQVLEELRYALELTKT